VPSGSDRDIFALHVFSKQDAWAATDEGRVLRWDGARWAEVLNLRGPLFPVGKKMSLYGIWGSRPDDLWLVGTRRVASDRPRPVLVHYDGRTAQAMTAPLGVLGGVITSVWGRASDDVYATGQYNTLLHWNGHVWRRVPTNVPGDLLTVTG